MIPTYGIGQPDRNSAFLEKRNSQGSSDPKIRYNRYATADVIQEMLDIAEQTVAYLEKSINIDSQRRRFDEMKRQSEAKEVAEEGHGEFYVSLRHLRRESLFLHPDLNIERLLVNRAPPRLTANNPGGESSLPITLALTSHSTRHNRFAVEKVDGRREWVMLDVDGPGVIVRWWITQYKFDGTIRIYLDGSDKPVLQGKGDELVGGKPGGVVGPPLGAMRSRGCNLYLPIPFKKHCKITYDGPNARETRKFADNIYYNINYLQYPQSTEMKTFTLADLKANAELLAEVQRELLAPEKNRLDADRTMYFHSTWRGDDHIPVFGNDYTKAQEWNCVTIKGRGVYVGDTMAVFNRPKKGPKGPWWGEGDEKIYVDGESFPSHFGTGTEDYFGYAWGTKARFDAPFHAQPIGGANKGVGHTTNTRVRMLDRIPFNSSLKMNMELMHWQSNTTIDYATTTYWYARDGAASNAQAVPERMRKKVGQIDVLESAPARIEQYRKGDIQLCLLGEDGKPLAGATIRVRQVRHELLFGGSVFPLVYELQKGNLKLPFEEGEPLQQFSKRYAELFNFATLPYYWWGYEKERGKPVHESRKRIAAWCKEWNITTKGHPLVWNHSQLPWLPDDLAEVETLQLAHVGNCVERLRGKVDVWDVVNETTNFAQTPNKARAPRVTAMWEKVGRIELPRKAFRTARKANPNATLLINDFHVGDDFAEVVRGLVDEHGKPLYDVIGLQSHMHSGNWSNTKLWDACERFAPFNKPVHFTELTMLSGKKGWHRPAPWPSTPQGEAEQAGEVKRVYTRMALPVVA